MVYALDFPFCPSSVFDDKKQKLAPSYYPGKDALEPTASPSLSRRQVAVIVPKVKPAEPKLELKIDNPDTEVGSEFSWFL